MNRIKSVFLSKWTLIASFFFWAVYFVHGLVIAKYASNVPMWDEWEFLRPEAFPSGFRLSWIFAQHNEHRILPSKLQAWTLFELNGWNVTSHIVLNYVLFGGALLAFIAFMRRVSPGWQVGAFLSFLLFYLSPALHQNHYWAFQSAFHFEVLFLLLTGVFLFHERLNLSRLALAGIFAFLTCFSLGSGLAAVLGLSGIFLLYAFFQLDRKKAFFFVAIFLAIVAATFALYFHDFTRSTENHIWSYPHQWVFWTYLFQLISGRLGINSSKWILGLISLVFILWPFLWKIAEKGPRALERSDWALLGMIAAVGAILASISLGRAHYQVASKNSRYSELTILLLPLTVLAWRNFLAHRPVALKRFLIIFWIFTFANFKDSWKLWHRYVEKDVEAQRGLKCAEDFYAAQARGEPHDGHCPDLYPWPMPDKLKVAKDLNLSFVREIKAKQQR